MNDNTTRRSPGLFGLMEAARRYRAGGSGRKATLMALMERMGDHDGEWSCWPSMATLADDTEQNVGTVRRHVARFEETGLIRRESRGLEGGGRAANRFVLDPARLEQTAHDARGAKRASGGPKRASVGGQSAHLAEVAPNKEHPVEEPEERGPSTDVDPKTDPDYRFDDFWAAYPRRNGKKLGKAKARERWRRLSYEHKAEAFRAVKNYSVAVGRGSTIPRDAERFLTGLWFQDWLDGPGAPETRRAGSSSALESNLEVLADLHGQATG